MPRTLLSVVNMHDNVNHVVVIDNLQKVKQVKYIMAKRMLTTPDNVNLYETPQMNEIMVSERVIGNTKVMYMYIDSYEEPIREYSWFRYYFCCGR